jgi:potassium channel subfamily K, other eukaryote
MMIHRKLRDLTLNRLTEISRDWWFAGTAVPLVAATLGPLANVLSIGALVTPWRYDLTNLDDPSTPLAETLGASIKDPQW